MGGILLNISNPKIEKVNSSIRKVKAQMTELSAKLRDLERRKTKLEDEEIVARFRREKTNEYGYHALKNAKFSPASIIINDNERNTSDADKINA